MYLVHVMYFCACLGHLCSYTKIWLVGHTNYLAFASHLAERK